MNKVEIRKVNGLLVMAEYGLDFQSGCRREADGSLTVTLEVRGIPDVDIANRVGGWLRKIVQENADELGRRDIAASKTETKAVDH
jgi:hypothetical protein